MRCRRGQRFSVGLQASSSALGVLAVAIMLFVEFPSALVFVIGVPIVVGLIVMVIRQGQEIWKLLKKPLNTLPPD